MFKTRITDIPGASVTNYNRHNVILWDQDGVYSTDCNKNVVAYNIIPTEPGQPGATYYDYTPFGAPVGNAALAKRFMFSSEEWFPVRSTLNYDLLLYLYRAYSPALARFLSRDPIGEVGGPNLYNFVANNPVTKWDETGAVAMDSINAQLEIAITTGNISLIRTLLATGVLSKTAEAAVVAYLAKVAKCLLLYENYKRIASKCRRCHESMSAKVAEKNAECFANEVWGRIQYLANRCDYYLSGSITKGSEKAEKGHWEEIAEKTAAWESCREIMFNCE